MPVLQRQLPRQRSPGIAGGHSGRPSSGESEVDSPPNAIGRPTRMQCEKSCVGDPPKRCSAAAASGQRSGFTIQYMMSQSRSAVGEAGDDRMAQQRRDSRRDEHIGGRHAGHDREMDGKPDRGPARASGSAALAERAAGDVAKHADRAVGPACRRRRRRERMSSVPRDQGGDQDRLEHRQSPDGREKLGWARHPAPQCHAWSRE